MRFTRIWGKLILLVLIFIFTFSCATFAQNEYQKKLEKFKQDSIAAEKYNKEQLAKKDVENKINAIKKSINDGNNFIKRKQWQSALDAYNDAILRSSDPQLDGTPYPKAYYGKGLALKNLRKYNEALQTYQQATQLDPLYADAHLAMATLYRKLKKYDYALTACKTASSVDTTNYKIYYELGTIYNKLKKYSLAANAFQQVTKLRPDNYRAFDALGVAQEKAGRTDEAIKAWQNAVKVNIKYEASYYRSAALLNNLGRYKEALDNALKSLKYKRKKNGKAAFEAGRAYEGLGQYQKAIEYYKMAGQLDRRWKKNADYQISMIERKLQAN